MIRLTREQVRSVDRICIEEYGLPGIVLMENAARSAAETIDFHHRGDGVEGTTAVIVCGGGNNGGDGYAIARHLHNDGWHVTIVAWPIADLTGDAAIMAAVALRMKLTIVETLDVIAGHPDSLLIDAITGTGLTKPLRGLAAEAVIAMNASGRSIVAIDLPSGLDCDTGEPLGDGCVRATRTVTFVAEKLGFANPRSREFTGPVIVGDIGCPSDVVARASGT